MADGRSGGRSWLEQMSPAGLEPGEPDHPEPRATPWVPDQTLRKFPADEGDEQGSRPSAGESATPAAASPAGADAERRQAPLAAPGVSDLQHRWLVTQGGLVDDPLDALLGAGRLIGDAIRLAAKRFSEQRVRADRARGDEGTDTDALRATMQRYRDAFQYVLAADELLDEIEEVRRSVRPVESAPEPTVADAALETDSAVSMSVATDLRERAAAVLTRLKSSPIAAVALLGLAALAIAFGLWRWSAADAPQGRALRVESLPYRWHIEGPPAPLRTPIEEPTDTATTPVARDAATEPVRPDTGAQPTADLAERSAAPLVEAGEDAPPLAQTETAVALTSPPAAPTASDPVATSESQPAEVLPLELGARFSQALEVSTPSVAAQSSPPIVDALSAPAEPALAAPSSEPLQVTQPAAVPDPETELITAAAPPISIPEPTPESAPAPVPDPVTPTAREIAATVDDGDVPEVPAPPAVEPGELVQLGEAGVAPPVMVVQPRAEYPSAAQRLRREAHVELHVLVDEQGRPERIEARGQDVGLGFDAAAHRAAEDARWRPATKDGVPVKVWVPITVRFQLDGR